MTLQWSLLHNWRKSNSQFHSIEKNCEAINKNISIKTLNPNNLITCLSTQCRGGLEKIKSVLVGWLYVCWVVTRVWIASEGWLYGALCSPLQSLGQAALCATPPSLSLALVQRHQLAHMLLLIWVVWPYCRLYRVFVQNLPQNVPTGVVSCNILIIWPRDSKTLIKAMENIDTLLIWRM